MATKNPPAPRNDSPSWPRHAFAQHASARLPVCWIPDPKHKDKFGDHWNKGTVTDMGPDHLQFRVPEDSNAEQDEYARAVFYMDKARVKELVKILQAWT